MSHSRGRSSTATATAVCTGTATAVCSGTRLRALNCLVVLGMLLSALLTGAQAAGAAPAGNALQFDGTTANKQHVTFGAAPGLGVTTFTLEAWVKRAAVGGLTMSTGSL